MSEGIFVRMQTGDLVNLLQPQDTNFNMGNIATALSRLCRFSGQTKDFYSVAEHSVYVSLLAEKLGGDPWAALWHDSSEAVMNDLITPLKRRFPEYLKIEEGVMAALGAQFFFTVPFDHHVHRADRLMTEVEGMQMLPGWQTSLTAQDFALVTGMKAACLEHDMARQLFLQRMKTVAAQVKPLLRLQQKAEV